MKGTTINTKFKSLLILIILIFSMLFSATSAMAVVDQKQLKSLTVSVYPEYDRQGQALLMYRGELPKGVKLPARVRFLLPARANLTSTSSVDDSNQFQYTKEWNSKKVVQKGDFTELTYNVYFPVFQFEAYQLVPTNNLARNFPFTFKAGMNIDNLIVELQQPLGAEKYKTTPKETRQGTDDQGFKVSTYDVGKVKAEEEKDFSITYDRNTTEPSLKDGAPQPVNTSGGGQAPTFIIIIVVIAMLLAIPIAIVLNNNKGTKFSQPVNKNYNKPKKKQQSGGGKKGGFCSQCGKPLQPGTKFCSSCGKRQ